MGSNRAFISFQKRDTLTPDGEVLEWSMVHSVNSRRARAAVDNLFRAYVGIINSQIQQYKSEPTEDDVQDAYVEAVEAIRTHDIMRGKFRTFVGSRIRALFADKIPREGHSKIPDPLDFD